MARGNWAEFSGGCWGIQRLAICYRPRLLGADCIRPMQKCWKTQCKRLHQSAQRQRLLRDYCRLGLKPDRIPLQKRELALAPSPNGPERSSGVNARPLRACRAGVEAFWFAVVDATDLVDQNGACRLILARFSRPRRQLMPAPAHHVTQEVARPDTERCNNAGELFGAQRRGSLSRRAAIFHHIYS